jgi:membrane peptidoglycan carboxypeptidase
MLVIGSLGFLGTVSAYAYYSRDLPDPKVLLTNIEFEQQTVILDRTGTVELARLGQQKREVVAFDEIPPEMVDATTAIEDKTFWENAGFDPIGIISAGLESATGGRERGASTITQQLVRARLLPQEAFEGTVYERKIREIIQSIRLTQEFPGDDGKRQIMAAYLNQNFYGNQSYGVKAAAYGYFGKELHELSLAQFAILAAIPQSPTKFDLVKNATEECLVEIADGEICPIGQARLVVPRSSEIVRRRDYILDLMKTRSPLSGEQHRQSEYEAAKREPAYLVDQRRSPWKAPHFVWQVRQQLSAILCPDRAPTTPCEAVDRGGYRVITTLDDDLQRIGERWIYAAARGPNSKDPEAVFEQQGIPRSEWKWLLNLQQRNIHNAAGAIIDYRTGEVLAYIGSASYYAPGTEKFQPQFDVLGDGWRQPGSAIKPINYLVGIEDRTMTAATMFMDVVTDFGKNYTPTQADGYERGPVRLRSALQFSLNVPSIKAGLINGLDHVLARSKDLGLRYGSGAIPVVSMGLGTLEVHPIDLLGAYGAMANGGVLMPRTMILEVTDSRGARVFPEENLVSRGKRVASAEASYIVTDILAGNTDKKVNPYWGEHAIFEGDARRPAAYKTGTTSDNRDVHAYGYLAPPEDPDAPALAAGIWMGNSNNEPNKGSLSLDSSAPLWSAILQEASAGSPIASFEDTRPKGVVTADVDAFSGLLPGPFTTRTVSELFIEGTVPTRRDQRLTLDIDQASGLLWQDGCAGPMVAGGFLDFTSVEPGHPEWQPFTRGWVERAMRGPGISGGPKGTRTTWFYNNSFAPYGKTWGGPFAPSGLCTPLPPTPSPEPPCEPPFKDCEEPVPVEPTTKPGGGGGPALPTPTPTPRPRPRRGVRIGPATGPPEGRRSIVRERRPSPRPRLRRALPDEGS